MGARLLHLLLTAFALTATACSTDGTGPAQMTTLDITGVITSAATGAPIAGARVELGFIRYLQSGTVTHATTNASGSYTLRPRVDCANSWYYFDVRANGYAVTSTLFSERPIPSCSAHPQTHSFSLAPFEASALGEAQN